MAWIRVVDEAEADGRLAEVYEDVRKRRGSVADILKVHSLNPDALEAHLDFYLAVQFGPKGEDGLGRAEREMVAVVVSAANRCAYCVKHHADALLKYWKDESRVDALARGDRKACALTTAEEAMCAFAERLTLDPGAADEAALVELRRHGLADEAVLQVILTTGYFNFVNRVALATGIDPAHDAAKKYDY